MAMSTIACNVLRLVVVVALVSLPRVTSAQAEDEAAARALFQDALKLRDARRMNEACAKFEAAAKLYTSSGLLLNVADCYEHFGRTASAWTTFADAAVVATRLNRTDDQAEARRRQAALEPTLSRLSIMVSSSAAGLSVERDARVLEKGAWGSAIPVDPGPHTVTATARGRVPWSVTVTVNEPGKTLMVTVPDLSLLPTPVALSSGAASVTESVRLTSQHTPYWSGRRVAGAAAAGTGLAAVGVGGILAVMAKAGFDKAEDEAGAARHDDSLPAVTLGNVASWSVGIGAGLALAGALLWLWPSTTRLAAATSGRSLGFEGSF